MTLDPKQHRKMTPEDESNAKIIALLMATAKMLECVTRIATSDPNNSNKESALKHVLSFLDVAIGLHGDGAKLEKDTLALAKELGFVVEQRYISKVPHA